MDDVHFLPTIIELSKSSAFLIIVVYLIGYFHSVLPSNPHIRNIFIGLLYGLATVVGMTMAMSLTEGVFFDARSVILGVATLFGGYLVGFVAALISIVYRLFIGGAGVITGVTVILVSVVVGAFFHYLKNRDQLRFVFTEFLVFGFVLHLLVIACFILIPNLTFDVMMHKIGIPVLMVYTPFTAILCSLIWNFINQRLLMAKLQENNDYMERLFDQSPIAQCIISNRDDTIVKANAALTSLTGFGESELAGFPVVDLFEKNAVNQASVDLIRHFDRNQPVVEKCKVNLTTKDGQSVYVEVSLRPVLATSGRNHERRAVFVDVTPLVQGKLALEASSVRLQSFLDQLTDPMVIHRSNGQVSFVNHAMRNLCCVEGFDNNADIYAFWPSHEVKKYQDLLSVTYQKGLIGVEKIQVPQKEEDVRELLCVMHPIVSPDGVVVEVLTVFDDQTDMIKAEGERKRLEIEHRNLERSLYKTLLSTIEAIAMTVEKRDPYTAGHQRRVTELAVAIAGKLNWDENKIEGLRLGAMIHDMGKIYVPAEILNRPGKLSDDEFNIIKSHPVIGEEIISAITFPWPVAKMVSQHHERVDGSGYPRQLKGYEIIEEAKVIAVADVVEAISSHRPYRAAIGIESALEEIRQGKETKYDLEVADACLELFEVDGYKLDFN